MRSAVRRPIDRTSYVTTSRPIPSEATERERVIRGVKLGRVCTNSKMMGRNGVRFQTLHLLPHQYHHYRRYKAVPVAEGAWQVDLGEGRQILRSLPHRPRWTGSLRREL